MKNILTPAALGLAVLASACTSMPAGNSASSAMSVEETWARATPAMATSSAAYMELTNHADTPDRLVSASGDVSARVELHTHINDDGMMRMVQVEAIDIPAGGTTVLQPRGLHVMLIDLEEPLNEGDRFPLTLTFENAGEMTVDVPVRRAGGGAGRQHDGMQHGGMKHQGMQQDGMQHGGMKHHGMQQDGMQHQGKKHQGMQQEGMQHQCMKHPQPVDGAMGKSHRSDVKASRAGTTTK